MARLGLLALAGALLAGVSPRAAEPLLSADFSVRSGTIRPLHGVNKGPLAPGGLFDVIQEQKELGIPFTRLHDCGWPNPHVVDHHVVFPDPRADPTLAESYDFGMTDEYIAAVLETGAEPIYRLGESIEHTRVKRHAHPPADMEKWTAVCLGIIRHYNEGWANGFHHNIRHWEIWNEPDNRPAMWSGDDEDYLELYRTAAKAIKQAFPTLKVGGPGLGSSGKLIGTELAPTEFVEKFLSMCRAEGVPLDFFSWHCYTDNPTELANRAKAIRRLLDSHGFTDTESHLNEWNHLPGNSWEPLTKAGTAMGRQRYYEAMGGAPGAAFAAASLIELQDAPVDVCNFFHGELGAFGLFTEQGVPLKVHQAFRAFQSLVQTPRRVETSGAVPGRLAFAAGLAEEGREASMLVGNLADPRSEIVVGWKGFSWEGGVDAEIRVVDATRDFSTVRTEFVEGQNPSLRLELKAPAVALIRLRPSAGAAAKAALSIASPANRLVFQRDLDGNASIRVAGRCAQAGAAVEARWVDVATGAPGEWTPFATVGEDFSYSGKLAGREGWWSLEVRAQGKERSTTNSVERVGIGEVFLVAGHSVAQGGEVNLPGAVDDRVNTIALPAGEMERRRRYQSTGEERWLPELVGTRFRSDVQPAPAGHGTYFWARFAERVARAQNVPVLILNAGFGGTNLEHWAISSRGEPFEHPFVKSAIRMPHLRVEHALKRYCSTTGLRAILADHGQNDWPERDAEKIFSNYKAWIEATRADAGFENLAVVVNRQSPPAGPNLVRRVQERVAREIPHCFPGPDYDTLAPADRPDGIHLGEAGATKAAELWAGALDEGFFRTATPLPGK